LPETRRRSISLQSSGAEHVIIRPDSFSTQRNAGMSSFEPSRMPAWLAPVCDERSVSHSTRAWLPSASQRAIVGVTPSRIARRSTGSARPSISRKMMPGTSVRIGSAVLRAMRRATRNVYSSSFTPATTATAVPTAEPSNATSSAAPKWSTWIASGAISAASLIMAASSASTSTKPDRTV
jgi:hypothetical protein